MSAATAVLLVALMATQGARGALPTLLGQPVASTAAHSQTESHVAFDGSQYLVVWTDYRERGDLGDIYATRVSASGAVLDSANLRLASKFHTQDEPVVAFGGGVFFVVWYNTFTSECFGVRVSQAGAVLDPFPINLAQGASVYGPRVAFDGTNFVVAMSENSTFGAHQVYTQRVSPAGALVGAPLLMSGAGGNHMWPDVACQASTGRCLVIWETGTANSDVLGARVDAGVLVDATPVPIGVAANNQSWITVTWAGTGRFFAAWQDNRGGPQEVRGALVDAATAGLTAVTVAASAGQPSSTFDGTDVVVTYQGGGRLLAARVDVTTGIVLASGARVCNDESAQSLSSVAWGAGNSGLAVWTDARQGDLDLYSALLPKGFTAGTLTAVPGTLLNTAGNAQRRVATATSAATGDTLAVWEELRLGVRRDVYMTRIAANGTLLDASPVLLGTGSLDQHEPSVAWVGGTWLVAWTDENQPAPTAVFRRVASDGTILDAAPRVLSPSGNLQSHPRAAATAAVFLVVFAEDLGAGNNNIYAVRVTPAGVLQDAPPLALATTAVAETKPVVGASGSTFVAAWLSRQPGPELYVRTATVTEAGVVSGAPGGIDAFPVPVWDADGALTCASSACLVAWPNGDLIGRQLGLDGNPQGNLLPLSLSAGSQERPSIVHRQGVYTLAFEDGSSAIHDEVSGLRLNAATLASLDTTQRAFTAGSREDRSDPNVFVTPAGTFLLLSTYDATPGVQAQRLGLQRIYHLFQGSPCAADGECVSEACVDGVCCSSACGGGAVDCQACSVAAGAAVDGVCSMIPAGGACRPAASSCDVAETCDGSSLVCPADAKAPDGQACGTSGLCGGGACLGDVSGGSGAGGFAGTPATFLTCGESYRYSDSGTPRVVGPGPVTFSLAAQPGEALPEGLAVVAGTGELSWRPTAEQAGAHRVYLVAQGAGWMAAQALDLVVECELRTAQVRCEQGAGGPLAGAALALLLARTLARPVARARRRGHHQAS